MSKLKIGYARVSTDAQDLSTQRDGLQALGVEVDRIYVNHGLSVTTRARPGLGEALACRAGDELVVTKLDRLARSLPDARDIADDLAALHRARHRCERRPGGRPRARAAAARRAA